MTKLNSKTIFSIINNIDKLDELDLSEKEKINYLVQLHDVGLIRYVLLNSTNYYYWWYEVPSNERPDKNKFTANLRNFKLTFKGEIFKKRYDGALDWYILINDIMERMEMEPFFIVDNLALFLKAHKSFQTYLL